MTSHADLRVGSVSLVSARKAARAAKVGTPASNASVSVEVFERYLGHFGPESRKAGARKSTTGKTTARKSSRKTAAKKSANGHAPRKSTSKKAAGSSKKR